MVNVISMTMNITAHALPLGLLLYNVFYTSFFLSFLPCPPIIIVNKL